MRLFGSKIFRKNGYGVNLGAPSSLAVNYNLRLPPTAGSANFFLKTDGSGNTDWAAIGASSKEYAANTSTADSDDFTSFTNTSAGATTPGPLTGNRFRRVRFLTPILTTDEITIEFSNSASGPFHDLASYDPATGVTSLIRQGGAYYGLGIYALYVNTTDMDIIFGRYCGNNDNLYYNTGGTWATNLGYWRVRKTSWTLNAINTGTLNVLLPNNATTSVVNVSNNDAGELSGWVTISATSSKRFFIRTQYAKNGAGSSYLLEYQTSGENPPSGFSMSITSGGVIQITMPSVAGYTAASITYGVTVAKVSAVDSMVRVATDNGYGSASNNKIRRFSTLVNSVGAGITYADSATNGASFTVTQNGVYSMSYVQKYSSDGEFGISLNASDLTAAIGSLSYAERLAVAHSNANRESCVAVTVRLSAGDVIRPTGDGTAGDAANPPTSFTITQVAVY